MDKQSGMKIPELMDKYDITKMTIYNTLKTNDLDKIKVKKDDDDDINENYLDNILDEPVTDKTEKSVSKDNMTDFNEKIDYDKLEKMDIA